MRRTLPFLLLLPLMLISTGACTLKTGNDKNNQTSACGSGPLFSRAPIDLEELAVLVPLGAENPPDHTFPASHLYLYVIDAWSATGPVDNSALLYAPADMTLTQLVLSYNQDYIIYSLVFSVCEEVRLYFLNVISVTHAKMVEEIEKSGCPADGAERNYEACKIYPNLKVTTGEVLGTVGALGKNFGLDVGVRDTRLEHGRTGFISPEKFCNIQKETVYERCYAACFFDYMEKTAAEPYLERAGGQGLKLTAEPRCGNIYYDVRGSAQGYWFFPGGSILSETTHLFLGQYPYNPSLEQFSTGTSIPGLNSGTYSYIPKDSGLVNRRFKDITDHSIYCFDGMSDGSGFTMLLQLSEDAQTVTVEKQNSSACGEGSWSFTSNPVSFER